MTQEVMIQIFESDFNKDGLVQTVNARDLHEALGVNRDFTSWIKYQLEDFNENQDFIIFTKNGEKSRGRPTKDYALTLDTAKHICMMARCEKGKEHSNVVRDIKNMLEGLGLYDFHPSILKDDDFKGFFINCKEK